MRKRLGQNFLINPSVRQALVEALGAQAGDEVWEIGPGLGAMTALLLEKELTVRAFEIDSGFVRILKDIFAGKKDFNLIEGDFLKTWSTQYSFVFGKAPFLLGNLPYNIAAVILAGLIEESCFFDRIVVTVQKEVALRMAASAGSPDYSSFSVLCASAYRVKPLMLIRPSSFYPQPNVDSMGVLLERQALDTAEIPPLFYPLVRSLFASRRKTIKNNLMTFASSRLAMFPAGTSAKDICGKILRENSLAENERAENLKPQVFLSLAKSIENMRV